MRVRLNQLEGYDMLYDFIELKHDQKVHAKKVVQHFCRYIFKNRENVKNSGMYEQLSRHTSI